MANSTGEKRRPNSLKGWRICITRAKAQAAALIETLEKLGATVIECPTIEIAPPTSWRELDDAIENLAGYDWLLFTSANGVEYFFERLNNLGKASSGKVGAVGQATTEALQRLGIKVNLIPDEQQGRGLLNALIETIGQDNIAAHKFLLPRAKFGRNELPDGLRALGATVDVVETYQTIRPDIDIVRLKETLASGVDAIIFTSPSTIQNLAGLLNPAIISDLLKQTAIACIGSTTSEAAMKAGLTVSIQPQSPNSESLVEAILSFASAFQKPI